MKRWATLTVLMAAGLGSVYPAAAQDPEETRVPYQKMLRWDL